MNPTRAPSGVWTDERPLILASNSSVRLKILQGLLIPVEVRPSGLAEREFEIDATETFKDQALACQLAAAKAFAVSKDRPGSFVLAADQVASLDGEVLHKPLSQVELKRRLRLLSGRTHSLCSAASLFKDGVPIFTESERATVKFRHLSLAFIDVFASLCDAEAATSSTGYRIEDSGLLLIDRYEGEFTTILGLPTLSILDQFRRRNLILS